MRALALGLLGFAAVNAAAEVSVEVRGSRVDVKAVTAPLSEVLGQIARQTGMKIVNEGPAPSMIVSLRLEGRTQPQAVFDVLEGLGLNYAFVTDQGGSKIETLIMAGTAGARPAAVTVAAAETPGPAPVRRPPERVGPPPASGPDAPDADDEAGEEPEPAEDGAAAGAGGVNPQAPRNPGGQSLQPPAEPVFPSSPFAPRAPMFMPTPPLVPQNPGQTPSPTAPTAQPTPPPRPPSNNQD
jgi:hypothetical protein